MNRFKEEERRKRQQAREGLTGEEVAAADEKEAYDEKIMRRAREIHAELFGEEYAFMYADAFGEPRPTAHALARKNECRRKHSLPLLDEEGKSEDFQGATMDHAIELAKREEQL